MAFCGHSVKCIPTLLYPGREAHGKARQTWCEKLKLNKRHTGSKMRTSDEEKGSNSLSNFLDIYNVFIQIYVIDIYLKPSLTYTLLMYINLSSMNFCVNSTNSVKISGTPSSLRHSHVRNRPNTWQNLNRT